MSKKYILQIGLAFTLLFAGLGSFLNPTDWISFVPGWVETFGISTTAALHAHAVAEIVLGLWLLTGVKVRWAAALIALDIFTIIVVSGFDRSVLLTTFRDVGLLATALYLAVTHEQNT